MKAGGSVRKPLNFSGFNARNSPHAGDDAGPAGARQHVVTLPALPCPAPQAASGASPAEWLCDSDTAVTADFVDYVRPLVGELVDYVILLKDQLPRRCDGGAAST